MTYTITLTEQEHDALIGLYEGMKEQETHHDGPVHDPFETYMEALKRIVEIEGEDE